MNPTNYGLIWTICFVTRAYPTKKMWCSRRMTSPLLVGSRTHSGDPLNCLDVQLGAPSILEAGSTSLWDIIILEKSMIANVFNEFLDGSFSYSAERNQGSEPPQESWAWRQTFGEAVMFHDDQHPLCMACEASYCDCSKWCLTMVEWYLMIMLNDGSWCVW